MEAQALNQATIYSCGWLYINLQSEILTGAKLKLAKASDETFQDLNFSGFDTIHCKKKL